MGSVSTKEGRDSMCTSKVGGGTRGRATDKEGLRLECSISNRSAKMQAPEA